MARKNCKKWYCSRGVWGGLLVAFGGVALLVGKLLGGELDVTTFLQQVVPLVGGGLGIVGIRLKKD